MKKTKFKQTEVGMIPEDWEVEKIDRLYDISSGLSKPRNEFGFGYPFLSFKDIFDNFSVPKELHQLVNSTEKERKSCSIMRGDVFLTRTSETMEELGLSSVALKDYENATFNGFAKRLRPRNQESLLPEFAVYLFRSNQIRKQILAFSSLTTRASLNASMIKEIKIMMPSIQEQWIIAKILSDLDSKIELSQQMNKTLEAIGQALFKHWFIDFEFPNDKGKPYKSSGGEMVDSELREIPKGWKVSTIGDEFQTILGGTPSTQNKHYWENGTVAWINSGEINKFRITEPTTYITENAVKNSATKLMPKGTTVLAITGATLGQVSRIEIDTCANQSVIGIIENKEIPSEYIYLWIKYMIVDLISHQTGGAQQHINKNNVNGLRILLPNNSLTLKFKEVMSPIFKNISINCFESQNLSQIRDSLLPRLMSGKIRVPVEGNT